MIAGLPNFVLRWSLRAAENSRRASRPHGNDGSWYKEYIARQKKAEQIKDYKTLLQMILKPICIWLQSCMVLVAVGEFLSSHAAKT